MSGRIAQNYRKIKSKNYKKNGTRMVAVFGPSFFDNFKNQFSYNFERSDP